MAFIRKHCLALVIFCLVSSSGSAGTARVFRSSDNHVEAYPTVQSVMYLSDRLAEATDGRLSIKVYHSDQLGQEKDVVQQVQFGVIDLSRCSFAALNNIVPETQVLSLPYLFRSVDHMHRVVDGPVGEEIFQAMADKGFIGLAYYDSGARSFFSKRGPINSLADMKGLKLRVQQSDLAIAMVQALGANPTPMPPGEVYSALQTGVIDGAENNWPSYHSQRFFEQAPHITYTDHQMQPDVLIMSKIVWDTLTPEDQQAIKQAARDSVARNRELWAVREKEALDGVVAGGAVVAHLDDDARAAFAAAVAPVYDQFVTDDTLRALVAKIQAVE
ncbi:MAG: TRAP transporter substrate-binding protein [Planctomycetes bacterium]|nr:TRAP transporter substrate-binding protein [Planctomycetota bacterium]